MIVNSLHLGDAKRRIKAGKRSSSVPPLTPLPTGADAPHLHRCRALDVPLVRLRTSASHLRHPSPRAFRSGVYDPRPAPGRNTKDEKGNGRFLDWRSEHLQGVALSQPLGIASLTNSRLRHAGMTNKTLLRSSQRQKRALFMRERFHWQKTVDAERVRQERYELTNLF